MMEEEIERQKKEILELLKRIEMLEDEVKDQAERISRLEREVMPLKVI